jgi:3-deoxy-D-manno-octulosonate 8-phosphate phosphatase (KDO 8-P phosphatase)
MLQLHARAGPIELLVLDVDGVMTDGSIVYTADGVEIKRFHVRDGSGLKFWHAQGKRSSIISGRRSPAVDLRAAELGIAPVFQGCSDKMAAFDRLLADTGFEPHQVCAIGDDLADVPLLRRAGLAIAVADACDEARAAADYTTSRRGGRGAVRDAIEWLMKLQGLWSETVAQFNGKREAA